VEGEGEGEQIVNVSNLQTRLYFDKRPVFAGQEWPSFMSATC